MENNELNTNVELLIEDNIEENNEEIINNVEFKDIFTDIGDPEVEGLLKRKQRKKLVIQPSFQRKFVWDLVKSSRLIESALLNIPLPIIYLSEEKDGKITVIDGQQRLTSFFNFIEDKKLNGSEFKLKGLKVLTECNGKKFGDLSEEYQDKILYTKLRTITFLKESDENLKFEIFERLNTGAIPLTAQELRNCIYRGKYNDLLVELAQDKTFMNFLNIIEPDSRMKDVELVLRFAAFHHRNFTGQFKKFLNGDMQLYKDISDEDVENLRNAFKDALAINKSLFGENAFKRYNKNEINQNGNWGTFSAVLYELLMVSLVKYDKNLIYQHLDSIREAWLSLITNSDFLDYINYRTANETSIKYRFNTWNNMLSTIIGDAQKQPRCFTFALKKELFESNNICTICGNNIATIDDAAVDHIEQYWLGGKTIPQNARLTHRYCNNSRPRIENKS